MGRAPKKNKKNIKAYVYETFYRKFGVVLFPFVREKNKNFIEKVQNVIEKVQNVIEKVQNI